MSLEDVYPLSPLQQGMLFHALQDPASGSYVNQLVCQLTGPLDAGALEAAWRWLVAQHPALRTAIVWEEVEAPLQVVLQQVEVPIVRHDWRGVPPTGSDSAGSGASSRIGPGASRWIRLRCCG